MLHVSADCREANQGDRQTSEATPHCSPESPVSVASLIVKVSIISADGPIASKPKDPGDQRGWYRRILIRKNCPDHGKVYWNFYHKYQLMHVSTCQLCPSLSYSFMVWISVGRFIAAIVMWYQLYNLCNVLVVVHFLFMAWAVKVEQILGHILCTKLIPNWYSAFTAASGCVAILGMYRWHDSSWRVNPEYTITWSVSSRFCVANVNIIRF